MAEAIRVEGLRDLVRAFQVANKEVAKDVRAVIEEAGEPIRRDAQALVRSELSGMRRTRQTSLPWYSIRKGIEKSTIGYIVPATRGGRRRGRDTKIAPKIAEREERARDANANRVFDEFTDALDRVARVWSRV